MNKVAPWEEAYQQIREEIINGSFSEGEPLPEVPLAKRFNINRNRVRQIFQQLESDSLIERIRNRGAFITRISSKDLQEIYEMRIALEGMAAKLAARRRDAQKVKSLIAAFRKASCNNGSLKGKEILTEKTHLFILNACENARIINALAPLQLQTQRIWHKGFHIPGLEGTVFSQHIEILKAVQAKDESAAERKMVEHISTSFQAHLNSMLDK
jgi:DNA-binding GntR family transcriptional regulator